MKGQIRASILGIAAAATLAACASKSPAGPTTVAAAGDAAQAPVSAEYQTLIENASKPTVVCRTHGVTGSRLHTRQVCLTPADMDDEHQQAAGALQDSRRSESMPRQMPTSMPRSLPSRP
jgi:hypothetical protein